MNRSMVTILMVLIASIVFSLSSALAVIYEPHDPGVVYQQTNNDYNDARPRMNNRYVLWQGWEVYTDTDYLLLWDQQNLQYVDTGCWEIQNAEMHQGKVVWEELFGGIFYRDMTTPNNPIIQVAPFTNPMENINPKINNGIVVWESYDGHDFEIAYWNGSTTTHLTNNSYDDHAPQINNGIVVWESYDGHDYEIYYWKAGVTKRLTNNNYDDFSPYVDYHGDVVWTSYDGHDYEIYYWKAGVTKRLTNNNYDDSAPFADHGEVVWVSNDGHDTEIYYWKAGVTKRLTNNNYDDISPGIHNSVVVWQGDDGHDEEIFCRDINKNKTYQVTNNNYDDLGPVIQYNKVSWMGSDGHDYEIYYWYKP